MNMIRHSTYLNWNTTYTSNNTSNISKKLLKVLFPHFDAQTLDMENHMDIDFY